MIKGKYLFAAAAILGTCFGLEACSTIPPQPKQFVCFAQNDRGEMWTWSTYRPALSEFRVRQLCHWGTYRFKTCHVWCKGPQPYSSWYFGTGR